MDETTYGRLDAPIGSHIVTPRWGYLHHGIYVGNGYAAHDYPPAIAWVTRKRAIRCAKHSRTSENMSMHT
jgi:hypothetical protein